MRHSAKERKPENRHASFGDISRRSTSLTPALDGPLRRTKYWYPQSNNVRYLCFAIVGFLMLSGGTGGPGVVWSQVSACLPGRNSKSCRKRWIHSLDPTLRKGAFPFHHLPRIYPTDILLLNPTLGRWTEEEDTLLTTAVEKYGTSWFQVAKMLPGRTDDQCAKRWRENLDPAISRKPWTEEDDELLMETYERIGKRWKDIASRFEGRPPVYCRNRVQSLVRARQRAAAAAVRKAAQVKLKGEKTAADEKIAVESRPVLLDFTCEVCIKISQPLSFG